MPPSTSSSAARRSQRRQLKAALIIQETTKRRAQKPGVFIWLSALRHLAPARPRDKSAPTRGRRLCLSARLLRAVIASKSSMTPRIKRARSLDDMKRISDRERIGAQELRFQHAPEEKSGNGRCASRRSRRRPPKPAPSFERESRCPAQRPGVPLRPPHKQKRRAKSPAFFSWCLAFQRLALASSSRWRRSMASASAASARACLRLPHAVMASDPIMMATIANAPGLSKRYIGLPPES